MTIKQASHLPAYTIADTVNQCLEKNSCLVITAPPGAGKSTLLPLTILQGAKLSGKTLILEPRRLAARQIAERMSAMINEPVGKTVGYRVRFEQKVSAETKIEVLTEGILTRMLVNDPTLDGVSLIIFDEFHERSMHSDVALALTREAQQIIRPDLRIVIMSATIDTSSICQALNAKLIECEGRMFPVDVIHTPEEATEQNVAEVVAHVIRQAHREQEGDILAFLPGEADIRRCQDLLAEALPNTAIRPLYGMLSSKDQQLAIAPSAAGERKVVLSTPIAETSLTIEGVRVVVDSGLCRTLFFDPQKGLSLLKTVRISKDMATQRMGRAGRLSSGICYRLWSLATEHRMEENRTPEIVDADLAPMLLDVTAWGESHAERLPWLTPPPPAHLRQASQLLQLLNAIDDKGLITEHGRRMSLLPCHPRIAQLLLKNKDDAHKALAADIAALLEEKDPLAVGNKDQTLIDVDINTRISLLRETRARKNSNNRRWDRIIRIAEQYRYMVHVDEDNRPMLSTDTGALLAAAYPERIAKSVSDGCGRFQLASGDIVSLDMQDDLAAKDWLAVAMVNQRIFLASPISEQDLRAMARQKDNLSWDNKRGIVVAQREYRIGSLLIDSKPIHDIDREQILQVLIEAAKKEGPSMFDFSEVVQNLQQRIQTVSEWHPELELPAIDQDSFLSQASDWLPMFVGKATSAAELKKIDLSAAIWSLLSYDQQQTVDRLAPTHITVPTGSRIRVEYRTGAEYPILRVRLQECFGLTDTPRVDDGRKPVLMELLSPGFKPVQLTQDLHSFWQGTYFEVRKELRRRYPKHSWPDNPLEAEPTRKTKTLK